MELPPIDLDLFLADPTSPAAIVEARKAAESLIQTGALVLKDSRAESCTNERFLNLFEDYFSRPNDELQKDERPELGYQVGVTLENTEKPKCSSDGECLKIIQDLEEDQRPLDLSGHGADPKCRFFHRMAEHYPYKSAFPSFNAPNVTPEGMVDWEERVNEWGYFMKQAVEGLTRMLAVGLGINEMTFVDAGRYGSHLLAPTATNLMKYGKLNEIYAGFHTDLNFLTIHGQSRYPGLHIWARNSGKRIAAKVPDGHLLVQAGKQLEWMTGGLIKAGFHEVVCTEGTLSAMQRRRSEHPDRPLIRISSTFFWHLTPDHHLSSLPKLRREAIERFGPQAEYGEMLVGDQVRRELGLIALMKND
ncbi:hypothetical protein P7C73_g231, partial [Tremellales sp. Uapishka_1]